MQQMSKSHEYFGSGLTGRDQELWEDFLRIFDNSWFAHQAKSVVEYYVNQRHNSIKNSFEARIFKILCDNLNENNEIESKAFWETLTVDNPDLPGNLDSFSGKSFYLDEFGFKLSPNTLARIIEDKFQGKKHSRIQQSDGKSKKITYYVFDPEVIKSLSSKYRIES
jgi:hypothetical protein